MNNRQTLLTALLFSFFIIVANASISDSMTSNSINLGVQTGGESVGSPPTTPTQGNVMTLANKNNVGYSYITYPTLGGFYDRDGDGRFGFYYWEIEKNELFWIASDGTSQRVPYHAVPYSTIGAPYPKMMEDVNGDGVLDIGFEGYYLNPKISYNTDAIMLSGPDGFYTTTRDLSMVPGLDLKGRGKNDYLYKYITSGGNVLQFEIHQLDAADSIQITPVIAKPFEEFQTEFDPNQWEQASEQAYFTGKGTPPVMSTVGVGGVLASVQALPTSFPQRALDLNRDGHIDMLDTRGRIAYLNMGDKGFATQAFNSDIIAKDLTGNGIVDFITYGGTDKKIIAHIYKGSGVVEEQVLMDANIAADPQIYCYDFNKDGYVDILITSSYDINNMGLFTVLAQNDGKGNFTIHEDYDAEGRRKMLGCADLNHDGYYDLILFDYTSDSPSVDILVRLGQPNYTFASPTKLYSITSHADSGESIIKYLLKELVVADIDQDNRPELMLSSYQYKLGDIYKYTSGNANTAPDTPAAPTVNYNAATGQVGIAWKRGSDAQSSPCDLTYALRIGSAPGLNDIVNSHALPNGARRNLMEGNMGFNLSKQYDCSTWKPGTYYVTLQVIDPAFKGSSFSSEVSFKHSYIPSEFTLSNHTVTASDTITVTYTPLPTPYEYNWELDNASTISNADGKLQLRWDSAGKKRITLTIRNSSTGEQSQVFAKTVTVLPSRLVQTMNDISGYSVDRVHYLIDYDLNGTLDYVAAGYYSKLNLLNGLIDNDGKGIFKKRGSLFNASLKPQDTWWVDWTNNGLPDMIFLEQGGNLSWNEGIKMLTQTTKGNYSASDFTPWWIQLPTDNLGDRKFCFIDINNDGLVDTYSHLNNGDGTFSLRYTEVYNGRYNKARFGSDSNGNTTSNIVDWNRDGYWDYWYLIQGTTSSSYSGIRILENPGNDTDLFTPHELLFPNANIEIFERNIRINDLNNDGYLDVILIRNNNVFSILYNDKNTRLLPAENIILDEIIDPTSYYGGYTFYDIDNNGYLDIITNVNDTKDNKLKPYILYLGEKGLIAQGFLCHEALQHTPLLRVFADVSGDGIPDSFISEKDGLTYFSKHRTTATNAAPKSPSGVVVQQTSKELVIEWEPAADDRTPPMQMRYNLSVKRKGKTGNGSYIISPMNDGIATAKTIPSNNAKWQYHGATQFKIPIGALPLEELEVSVQAIDLWDVSSAFSPIVTVKIEEMATLEMPANVCIDSPVEIRYTGVQQNTPSWDFDGGKIIDGSGFGPYRVQWNSSGLKTVHVSTSGTSSSIQTFVGSEIPASFDFPSEVYCNQEIEFALPTVSPKNGNLSWTFELPQGYPQSAIKMSATAGRSIGNVTFSDKSVYGEAKIKFTVHVNECSRTFEQTFTIYPPIALPEIGYVGQAFGKNIINWDAEQLSSDISTIIVYKEGASFNDFIEIGRVDKNVQQVTDASSNTTVKSERYRIAGIMTNGLTTPLGKVHKTIHLTINQGIGGQWNLIWNQYDGCPINNYSILRGSSPETLHSIAQLSGSATSFTDVQPNVSEPYYALSYKPLPYYSSSTQARTKGNRDAIEVSSNVVFNQNAKTIIFVEKLDIMSMLALVELNDKQRSLPLYAEVSPWNAAYQNVAWSIVSGSELADISPFGVLTGRTNASGTIRVQAKSTDGTNITATRDIVIKPFAAECGEASALGASVSGSEVTLTWSGSADSFNVMWRLKSDFKWSNREIAANMLTLQTADFPAEGEYEWAVESRCSGNIIASTSGPTFNYTPSVGVNDAELVSSTCIYPNPTKDVLYIKTATTPKQVFILSLQGQVVISADRATSINTSSLSPNVYIVRIVNDNGGITHHRIVKK